MLEYNQLRSGLSILFQHVIDLAHGGRALAWRRHDRHIVARYHDQVQLTDMPNVSRRSADYD